MYAATGDYIDGVLDPSNDERNLRSRGYEVIVSGNARDGKWDKKNVPRSDDFGADIHVVTHTNAFGGGCGSSAQYFLAMWRDGAASTGKALAEVFASTVGEAVPGADSSGTDKHYFGGSLGELADPDADYRVYNEVFFHTNEDAVNWMESGRGIGNGVKNGAWRYGLAIDEFLGHPDENPPASASYSTLSGVPGFGRAPGDARRDEAIAVWEAYKREVSVAECMAAAGFDYEPEVGSAARVVIDVVADLKLRDRGVAPTGGAVLSGSPNSPNEALLDALDPARRDGYYQALYGVSESDYTDYARSGIIPEGEGPDYARGGCFGSAKAKIPSVWALRREILPELIDRRRALSTGPEMAGVRAELSACASGHGVDAETMSELQARSADGAPGGRAALKACGDIWREGISLARTKLDNTLAKTVYAARLQRQRSAYDGVLDKIAVDTGFIAYIVAAADEARPRLEAAERLAGIADE